MNIEIRTFIRYSGTTEGLKPLLEDLGAALINNGFGSKDDDNIVKSLIVVRESEIIQWESVQQFAESLLDDSFLLVMPTDDREEHADSTGD